MSGDVETLPEGTNLTTTPLIRCVGSGDYQLEIAQMMVAVIILPLHLFILIAMLAYRDVIKRNVVNIYAGNVIFSGLVANLWRIYINADQINSIDNVNFINMTDNNSSIEPNEWDAFKKGLNLIMTLVASGSVGLVINAMRSIQFRVHKTVGGVSSLATKPPCKRKGICQCLDKIRQSYKLHPKSWALIYIAIVWIIPLVLTALSAAFNTCDYACYCAGLNVPYPDIAEVNCKESSSCSKILPPVGRTTMNVGFSMWLLYWLILSFSIAKTYVDLRNLKRQRIHSMKVLNEEREAEALDKNLDSKGVPHSSVSVEETSRSEDDIAKSSNTIRLAAIKVNTPKNGTATRISGSIFVHSLRKNFKLLFIMYLSYLIGNAPIAILALVDGTGNATFGKEFTPALVVFIILPPIAEAVCTIMVCMYLSGVKSATRSLLVKACRCFQ